MALALGGAPAFGQTEATGSARVRAETGAAAHPRVLLLALTDDDPLAARLAAELEALGLAVTRGKIDPAVAIDEHVRQALAAGIRCVVVADGRRTEFWVSEEGSERIALRQELEIENSPGMESVLSLRTVEFLRVSLGLAGRSEPLNAPVVVAPPPAPPAAPPPVPERRVAFGLVSGAVVAKGLLAPYATIGAGVRVRVTGPAGVELRGLAPLATQSIAGPDGPVDASVWLAGGGVVFAPRLAPIGFELGAGALAAIMRATARDTASVRGLTDSAVGLAFYGRAAGRLQLGPSWAARVDVLGGSTAARPLVIVGSTARVAAWGAGFVAALAGVEACF